MLRNLVFSFECDNGQDEAIYWHTKQLIASMLGQHVSQIFDKYLDACENKFYFKSSSMALECWERMCEEAKQPDPFPS